ncbi:hypothetical protein LZ016_07275 [Sphingomonas sp. SM33]|uniref:DUF2254 domain-containing protein n=1 Tax=Sphingomonas telluris TaxID=2907998 RepID=A0ABS9VLQ7_9SPHN|nr:hypothetical protein [Sphingomonas telluris]MCH8615899.1 hypothetical protein [Sphingomonas telluris]
MATVDTPDEEQAAPEAPVAWMERARKSAMTIRSRLLLGASGRSVRALYWLRQHGRRAEVVAWLISVGVGAKLLSELRLGIAAWFAPPRLGGLQTLLVGTGTALIGGTAIAASLVLFAMQVNVERLPFGLFRRLSSDLKLLLAFAGSFGLAIGVASFSLISSPANAAFCVGAAILFVLLILRSFLYAYRRSLALISPEYQLELIKLDVAKEARRWDRRARWAEPLLDKQQADGKFDQLRYTISQVDPRLRIAADKGLKHSVALARKLSDQGDAIAAESALQTVVVINQLYVAARGRSFFASTLIGDNEHVHDPIITHSIEAIKNYYRSALGRRDEEQMISALGTLKALAGAYLGIEYRDDFDSKTHACYAAGQLQTEVEQLVAHLMPDALYRAVGILGTCARELAVRSRPEDAVPLVQKIAALGATGAAREDHIVITHAATEQLAKMTVLLFGVERFDPGYATRETLASTISMTKLVLGSSHARQAPFGSPLDSYFSGVPRKLGELTNALLKADVGDEHAQQVARNVEEWAEELHRPIKELLLQSVEKQSIFTIILIQFVHSVTEALLAMASAECCRDHERDELRKHALWLVSVFSWLPTEPDSALHVHNLSFIEYLLQIAGAARRWGGDDVLDEVRKRLLKWSIAVSLHQWDALENGIYALASMAVAQGDGERDRLLRDLQANVNEAFVGKETRDHVARELRMKAENLRDRQFEINVIERALTSVEREPIKALLRDAANILSPDTKDEPVRSVIL